MDDNDENDRLLPEEDANHNGAGIRTRNRSDSDAIVRDESSYQNISGDHTIDIESNAVCDLAIDENSEIPGEPLKLLVSFIFLICGASASFLSLSMTHDRVPLNYKPLPDIFLDNFPYQTWGLDASEYIIIISSWTAAILVLFHKHRTIVARRICLLVGLHYFYRSVTFFVTVLPKPDEKFICAPQQNDTTVLVILQRFAKLATGFGLTINGGYVYCGDYIYSGHTTMLVSCYLIIQEYSPRKWFLLHYTFFTTSALGIIFLLLERGHYSVDCIVAYWITTRVWWMYHTLANNEAMKAELNPTGSNFSVNNSNYLRRAWWWHIFCYFERNVPHNLPHKFSLPIPKKIQDSRPIQYIKQRLNGEYSDSSVDESRSNLLSSNSVIGYSSTHNSTSQNE